MRPIFVLALALPAAALAQDRYELTLDLGVVATQYNNVRIPGDEGTKFSFADLVGREGRSFFRLEGTGRLGHKHGFRILIAPLVIRGTGTLDESTDFDGATFAPGVDTQGTYKFNSYRATWWWQLQRTERSESRYGVTVKIRDAEIRLEQGSLTRSSTDLGFVPLLYFWHREQFTDKFYGTFDFDGLIGPGGRAFDFGFRLGYAISDKVDLTTGVRFLEGGADNPRVYNFAGFGFASAGVTVRF